MFYREASRPVRGQYLRVWAQPPGWVFHGFLVVPTAALLWAASAPVGDFLLTVSSVFALAVAAFIWNVRVALATWVRVRWSWWFPVAPLVGALVAGLVVADVPRPVRWDLSRGAFESVVVGLPPASADAEWHDIDVPTWVGAYRIIGAYRVGTAVIFYEETGALFDDAGFAYLPDGPDPALANGSFESPRYHHLDGPWYTWVAGW
ncbi:hypothetical protein I6A84_23435 [Frankia sp. CNm7]|uniref:Uncharacterized protein n=1 Tax=Frankia nepalensis TaxID=1836974 RepID=A0A937UR12_9ACTN|nr:hypothetical protein [Frankia nepalensis]MBL7497853.1 hypothetical protein [Frankia nepalensis]MBL7509676.1 hypothetical protein [Frankia nepalensis]MBL7520959.1 hypothetical protein [Frankia nepalensis]MBL7630827.1 hypothetical protein [Frankia nepalensis]